MGKRECRWHIICPVFVAHHLSGLIGTRKGAEMKRTIVLQEIRQMRFAELYGRQQAGRLTQEEMAEVLNIDVRTARRGARRERR